MQSKNEYQQSEFIHSLVKYNIAQVRGLFGKCFEKRLGSKHIDIFNDIWRYISYY